MTEHKKVLKRWAVYDIISKKHDRENYRIKTANKNFVYMKYYKFNELGPNNTFFYEHTSFNVTRNMNCLKCNSNHISRIANFWAIWKVTFDGFNEWLNRLDGLSDEKIHSCQKQQKISGFVKRSFHGCIICSNLFPKECSRFVRPCNVK